MSRKNNRKKKSRVVMSDSGGSIDSEFGNPVSSKKIAVPNKRVSKRLQKKKKDEKKTEKRYNLPSSSEGFTSSVSSQLTISEFDINEEIKKTKTKKKLNVNGTPKSKKRNINEKKTVPMPKKSILKPTKKYTNVKSIKKPLVPEKSLRKKTKMNTAVNKKIGKYAGSGVAKNSNGNGNRSRKLKTYVDSKSKAKMQKTAKTVKLKEKKNGRINGGCGQKRSYKHILTFDNHAKGGSDDDKSVGKEKRTISFGVMNKNKRRRIDSKQKFIRNSHQIYVPKNGNQKKISKEKFRINDEQRKSVKKMEKKVTKVENNLRSRRKNKNDEYLTVDQIAKHNAGTANSSRLEMSEKRVELLMSERSELTDTESDVDSDEDVESLSMESDSSDHAFEMNDKIMEDEYEKTEVMKSRINGNANEIAKDNAMDVDVVVNGNEGKIVSSDDDEQSVHGVQCKMSATDDSVVVLKFRIGSEKNIKVIIVKS